MATKQKVKPRPHGRVKVKQSDDAETVKLQTAAVVKFDKAFRLKLPTHLPSAQTNPASSGHYVQSEGDGFHNVEYPIADGRYRVAGSDWIHKFEGCGYVESEVATPPNYGGPGVIAVEAPQPGNG